MITWKQFLKKLSESFNPNYQAFLDLRKGTGLDNDDIVDKTKSVGAKDILGEEPPPKKSINTEPISVWNSLTKDEIALIEQGLKIGGIVGIKLADKLQIMKGQKNASLVGKIGSDKQGTIEIRKSYPFLNIIGSRINFNRGFALDKLKRLLS